MAGSLKELIFLDSLLIHSLQHLPRFTVPSEKNMAIIGWEGGKELSKAKYEKYSTEDRKSVEIKLKEMRPMSELLNVLRKKRESL